MLAALIRLLGAIKSWSGPFRYCAVGVKQPAAGGESGVGKTAIAEGLAWRIVQGDVPDVISECTLYSLDIGSLLAGTKYRGDFENGLRHC